MAIGIIHTFATQWMVTTKVPICVVIKSGMEKMGFESFGIDDRILKAISRLGWAKPTAIQRNAIPNVLAGKDLLVKAHTGSGKTAIFAIPIIQKILDHKSIDILENHIRALILVPSKDLANQINENIKKLTAYCANDIHCHQLISNQNAARDIYIGPEVHNADIIISTPAALLKILQKHQIKLKNTLEVIVIDEADLLLSFGYESDFKDLIKYLPSTCQTLLMSATLNKDVKFLKNLMLHDPVIVKLEDSKLPPDSQLTQYVIKCEEDIEKFTLCYVILKLNLLRGKTLFFVNSIDRCYKLKLFLELFGIKSCLLNSELPLLSRCHIMSQFNEGLYDYVIAADESLKQVTNGDMQRGKKASKDKEFRASRGLDFQRISNVVNFDFPPTVKGYVHRVGRTARANNMGTALSFVRNDEKQYLAKVEKYLSPKAGGGGDTLNEPKIKTFNVPLKHLEGFKYRAQDAFNAVTRIAIREARLKEIKAELLKCERLKSYFQNNPQDLAVLRHDQMATTKNSSLTKMGVICAYLKHVPDYLIPSSLRELNPNTTSSNKRSARPVKNKDHASIPAKVKKQRAQDPLKSFTFED